MRTATPLRTWSITRVWGRSATSPAISTPRFIGPGCMITASGPSASTRRRVSPNRAVYSRSDGTSASVIRSFCIRNR